MTAGLLGAVPTLAFPEPGLWWLAFVGFVPLLLSLRAAPSAREAMARGWVGGAGFFLAMHHWLLPQVSVFALPLAFLLAVLWLPWAYLAWFLTRPPLSPARLVGSVTVLPSAWVSAELVRSWEHLGGPWGLLGTSQWANQRVLGLAAVAGVWALSFVVMAVNVAVATALAPGMEWSARSGAVVIGGSVLALTVAIGDRSAGPVERVVAVAGVQPGVIHGPEERLRAHEAATLPLAGAHPDLVVWGESSVGLDVESRPDQLARLASVAHAVGADVLVNVDARRGPGGIYKSSVLVGPDGPVGRYDKIRMVPFGEHIPLRPVLGWASSVSQAASEDRRRGSGLRLLPAGDLRIGPLVCFESAFPDLSRQLATQGADLIVVQAATTTFQGSWAQPQHASLAAVRAVETGRPVVHATLSGVTAVVDHTGQVRLWAPTTRRGAWAVTVPITAGTTPYVQLGPWVPLTCTLLLALLALLA
ncbi:MAG TPA: apolipoprotein N-acyltransferase, partial [Chloroflexota bacterium]|nr:apolipoprotein N-acyltransferase [Chloroflexota bacterium]